MVVAVAGCAGGPGPATGPLSTTAAAPSDRFGAPQVLTPKDARGAADTPCSALLSPDELEQLGFTPPGRQRTSIDVQECSWTNASDESLAMAVNPDRDLLVDTYRTRLARVFVPTVVAGMPAVRQRMALDDNRCTVTTGLGPSQALETEWSGFSREQTSDPCERAEEAIALVIRKLPPQR